MSSLYRKSWVAAPFARSAACVWLVCTLLKAEVQAPSAEPVPPSATLAGIVVDATDAVLANSHLELTINGSNQPVLKSQTDRMGRFSFRDVLPGPFSLLITSSGFGSKTISGLLRPGEHSELPPITLLLAALSTELEVSASTKEVAEAQVKSEEKQRLLGIIPNFNVVYFHDAPSLKTKQKFELAWKTVFDPTAFPIAGAIAGVQQANNSFKGYGQGAQGYAKRFGAAYGDFLSSTLIGQAILPSLLRQDPRYFYKGAGTTRLRAWYALANAVVCKGDNGHWQPSYSRVGGDLASGGLSYLYYPARDRKGTGLVFENALIGVGAQAAANLLQEFLFRKLTPKASKPDAVASKN